MKKNKIIKHTYYSSLLFSLKCKNVVKKVFPSVLVYILLSLSSNFLLSFSICSFSQLRFHFFFVAIPVIDNITVTTEIKNIIFTPHIA